MRTASTAAVAAAVALVFTGAAFAHAGLSPGVVKAGADQEFTLTVPTEEEGTTTTRVELTAPEGLTIFAVEDAPGWKQEVVRVGSGEEAVIRRIVWSGGSVPTEHLAVFRLVGSAQDAKDYVVQVRQSYANGEVVDWSGTEDSDAPAPTVEALSSLGGGSSSTLSIVALVVAGIGVLLAVVGLTTKGRPLA